MRGSIAPETSVHGLWTRRSAFIFAAIGSAVGLGNIWKFPYMAGENGGAAFVLVYLACVLVIGLPVMISEILLGRRGRHSPAQTMRRLVVEDGRHRSWEAIGWLGMLSGLLILSFYAVIAGWIFSYLISSAMGVFQGMDAPAALAHYSNLIASPWQLLFWHTAVIGVTAWVIRYGVNRGIEQATSIMMPLLFALLLLLVGYAALFGEFALGLSYLFAADFSRLSPEVALDAMGQAFFSLSIGLGAIMAYGAYLPRKFSITHAAGMVVAADTVVALLMGLALFPIVFASQLEPGAGPGLIFQTLVVAFGQMPGGWLLGTLFFLLTLIAAWTSAISLMEPAVSWLVDTQGLRRRTSTWLVALIAWLVGIGTVVSFNIGEDWTLLGRTFFAWLDYLSTNIMLPLGGMLIALYTGWKVRRLILREELKMGGFPFHLWLWLVRVVVPVAILGILLHGIGLL